MCKDKGEVHLPKFCTAGGSSLDENAMLYCEIQNTLVLKSVAFQSTVVFLTLVFFALLSRFLADVLDLFLPLF